MEEDLRLSAVARVVARLATKDDRSGLLRTVCEEYARATGASLVEVWLDEGMGEALRARVGDGAETTTEHPFAVDGARVGTLRFSGPRDATLLAAFGDLCGLAARRRHDAQLRATDRLASAGALAAGLAHEINNPLAIVLTNLDWVERTLEAVADDLEGGAEPVVAAAGIGDCLSALAEAHQGIDRVRNLVRELRAISRPESDTRERIDLVEIVHAAIAFAGAEVRQRAQLELAVSPVPRVKASATQLRQVVVNLLLNAAQALSEGGVGHVVRVGTRVDGESVRLDVSGTGAGIAADIADRVFDPFFTTKPVGEGTGLGLCICQSIVRALGGEISFESEVGRGTTFTVRLPPADHS